MAEESEKKKGGLRGFLSRICWVIVIAITFAFVGPHIRNWDKCPSFLKWTLHPSLVWDDYVQKGGNR